MLFSIVIPTHNRADFLRRTLESVFAQRFADYELIVVDDGSADETPALLEGLKGRLKALRQANLGPGSARNLGMQHATGDYVAFLDSDDLWFPWTLEIFAQLIREHDHPAILSGSLRQFIEEAELGRTRETPARVKVYPDFLSSRETYHAVGSGTSVIRRSTLLASGGFTTRLINGEDHDLILRICTEKGFVQVLEPIMLGWRRHPEGATTNLSRYVEGSNFLISQELAGKYPGGDARARERWEILGRHVRPVVFECLRKREFADAWRLYRRTFRWNLVLGRWRYLAGFPLVALWNARPRIE